MRVLVAEDDEALRSVLERGLRGAGYVVDSAGDGAEALAYLRTYEYEVAVIDWRMPVMSGIEVVQALRRSSGARAPGGETQRTGGSPADGTPGGARSSSGPTGPGGGNVVPILMLTARDLPADRVLGLDEGADDYMVKPFDFAELLARLRALQRRSTEGRFPRISVGDLVYEPATRTVRAGGVGVSLTQTELGILEVLLYRSPAVVTRRSIALQVWDDEADAVGSNTIDVHVARLRSKLSAAHVHIETHRGIGYRLVPS